MMMIKNNSGPDDGLEVYLELEASLTVWNSNKNDQHQSS